MKKRVAEGFIKIRPREKSGPTPAPTGSFHLKIGAAYHHENGHISL